MFIPLLKVDAAQRLVYGSFDETPDRAKEICDYATAKGEFQAWSEQMHKASGGKSFGNIRGQHNPKIAAGLLKSIEFDDAAKRIDFCAKIVDDNEWAKVEEGVYTGFSPGGSYAKRWADGDFHRYTPKVGELSIVDIPCNPNAGFMLTKADGSEEEIPFLIAKAYEPGNEATKARAIELAKAANPEAPEAEFETLPFRKNFIGTARAELIAENAAAELEKLAKAAEAEGGEPGAGGPDDQPGEGEKEPALGKAADDRAAALESALEKAENSAKDNSSAEPEGDLIATIAAAITGQPLAKAASNLPFPLPSPEAVSLIGADLEKSLAACALIDAKTKPLAKGLYSITDVACSLNSFSWIAQAVCDEERWEGDAASPLPQQAIDIVNALKAFLIALVEEEVAEMLERTQSDISDVIAIVIDGDGDAEILELANKITDLVKSDSALMEKAGARNSAKDASTIQGIHDAAMSLGADCPDNSADKVAGLESENERLAKSVDSAIPRIEALAETVENLKGELAKSAEKIAALEAQPVSTGKGQIFSRSKEEDGDELEKKAPEPGSLDEILAMPQGPGRQKALDAAAERSRIQSRR